MSKAQDAPRARSNMRAWGGFTLALSFLLVTVPAAGHHIAPSATVLLLDEVDPLPHWHSAVVTWEGTKTIEGDMFIEDPDAGKLVKGGDEPMGGFAVVLEIRQPDGSWRWFASVGGITAERSSHDARVRVRDPFEFDIENNPYYRLVHNSSFGWSLTSTGGTYRVTTWAAAEYAGSYRAPLRAEPGVTLLAHNEGDEVAWRRADDTALVSGGASAIGHGAWARALAHVDATIENSAYILHPPMNPVYPTQQCICRYTGPHPDWNGDIKWYAPASVYNGPPGTYAVDVHASMNGWSYVSPNHPTRIVPIAYNDALAWVFADVVPADV